MVIKKRFPQRCERIALVRPQIRPPRSGHGLGERHHFLCGRDLSPLIVKKVCIAQIVVSIPETMVCTNEKMVPALETMVFVSHTKDSETKTIVEADR